MCNYETTQWADDCKRQALECRDLLLSTTNHSVFRIFLEDLKNEIQAGEWMLAIEAICENIYEFEITINQEIYVKLCETCKKFDIDVSYTDDIKYLIRTKNKED
jgi:hypothetical protein